MRTIDYLYILNVIMLVLSGPRIYSDYKHEDGTLLLRLYFYFEIFYVFNSFFIFVCPRIAGLWCICAAIVSGVNTWRDDKELKRINNNSHWGTYSHKLYIGCIGLVFVGVYFLIDLFNGDPMTYLFK